MRDVFKEEEENIGDLLKGVMKGMKVARACDGKKNRFLVTAPHASDANYPLDDPCTRDIAERIDTLLRHKNKECFTAIATTSRSKGDQNRLHTLSSLNDVSSKLLHFAKERGRDWSDVIHVDIHSFTDTDDDLPPTWGRGVNVIYLKEDKIQGKFAKRMCSRMDKFLNGVLPPCTPVEHDRLPTRIGDDDSNAMIEVSRHLGALSLLIEFPTHTEDNKKWRTRASVQLLAEAVVSSLIKEMETSSVA